MKHIRRSSEDCALSEIPAAFLRFRLLRPQRHLTQRDDAYYIALYSYELPI